ncbi:hypothetical protein KIH79_11080 [Bifidobacterium sp. 82T10]|uniref:Uncharacterized protein n=1 Tax=Bifidobacterium miconis TaxID=2834435 RepID=A0ABS6WHL3_9BIFI|nr:hypothetical protein [Bifidobacterium miconis]MBW3093452.1 hypothetical protein [Bifidobacterium miconis]
MTIMIKPETQGLKHGSKAVGIEYAIRRARDKAWLFDADWDGNDVSWEPYADDATWQGDFEDIIRLAALNQLLTYDDADNPHLINGLEFVSRPWFYEEDYLDLDEDTPLDVLDFSLIGVNPEEFTE